MDPRTELRRLKDYGILGKMRSLIVESFQDNVERGFLIQTNETGLVTSETIIGDEGSLDLPLYPALASFHTHPRKNWFDCSKNDAHDMMQAHWEYLIIGSVKGRTPAIVVHYPRNPRYSTLQQKLQQSLPLSDEERHLLNIPVSSYKEILKRYPIRHALTRL